MTGNCCSVDGDGEKVVIKGLWEDITPPSVLSLDEYEDILLQFLE